MIPDRYRTRRIKERYLQALKAIPLPIRTTTTPEPVLTFDLVGLPILATEPIGDRDVRYSLVLGQARFRLTFTNIDPNLIGHIIDLDTPNPRLIIAGPLHTEWALTHETKLTTTATKTWTNHTRTCDN